MVKKTPEQVPTLIVASLSQRLSGVAKYQEFPVLFLPTSAFRVRRSFSPQRLSIIAVTRYIHLNISGEVFPLITLYKHNQDFQEGTVKTHKFTICSQPKY